MLQLEVLGNIGADAQVKSAQGSKFISFSVAHTDKWKDADGMEHRETTWVDCIINGDDSKVFPFLKSGVRVWVRGLARLRVFSSAKDRKMKAGITLNVRDIELCGGSSDEVPRELIVPADGSIVKVTKHYWTGLVDLKLKENETRTLIDRQGFEYVLQPDGFVVPKPHEEENSKES